MMNSLRHFFLILLLCISSASHAIIRCLEDDSKDKSKPVTVQPDSQISDEVLAQLLTNGIRTKEDLQAAFSMLTQIAPDWTRFFDGADKLIRLEPADYEGPSYEDNTAFKIESVNIAPVEVVFRMATDDTAPISLLTFLQTVVWAKTPVHARAVQAKDSTLLAPSPEFYDHVLTSQLEHKVITFNNLSDLLEDIRKQLRKGHSDFAKNFHAFLKFIELERRRNFFPQLKDQWLSEGLQVTKRIDALRTVLMHRQFVFHGVRAVIPDTLYEINGFAKKDCPEMEVPLLDQAVEKMSRAEREVEQLQDWLWDLPPRRPKDFRRALTYDATVSAHDNDQPILDPPPAQLVAFQSALDQFDVEIHDYLKIIDSYYGLRIP